jgi:hypothetical protein
LDFHIYAILDFDFLIGYPLKKLFQEKTFHGSLSKKLGKPLLLLTQLSQ